MRVVTEKKAGMCKNNSEMAFVIFDFFKEGCCNAIISQKE
jgi:hypothetical protein